MRFICSQAEIRIPHLTTGLPDTLLCIGVTNKGHEAPRA